MAENVKEKTAEKKKDAKSAQVEDEADVEEKVEEDVIPEVAGAVIVDEAEDEKELKEKIKRDLAKEKRVKPALLDEYGTAVEWIPKTQLGKRVYDGELKTISEILAESAPIREVGIVDKLLPGLQEEVIDVGRVQRVTDSGRRMRFRVVTAVGNGDGYVGVGEATGKEAGTTIRKSIERAKLNIREIKRGCGSWECGCGKPHTVPFKVNGKSGSVQVKLLPGPRGVGIVSGQVAKTILLLAGITDVWVLTEGHTRSGLNFAHAVVDALENTNYVKISQKDEERLKIVKGASRPHVPFEEVAK